MGGLFRKLFVFTVFAALPAAAQNLGAGIRGGVPLSDFLEAESRTGTLVNVVRGRGNVILGPMIDIRLPLGLGIEFDALYRRWDAKGVLDTGSNSSWEFPLYAKIRTPGIIVRPYVGAGMNFQRLGDVRSFITGNDIDTNRRGFLMAGGVDLKVPVVRVMPEIRYTRWPSKGALRSSNQVDFLIGITF